MISKELIYLFERLRIARGGVSQLDLIDGIISVTQYRRYLKGTSKLPFKVIVEFSKRLGLNYNFVITYKYTSNNVQKKFFS